MRIADVRCHVLRAPLLGGNPLDAAVIWDISRAAMCDGGLARGVAVQATSGRFERIDGAVAGAQVPGLGVEPDSAALARFEV